MSGGPAGGGMSGGGTGLMSGGGLSMGSGGRGKSGFGGCSIAMGAGRCKTLAYARLMRLGLWDRLPS